MRRTLSFLLAAAMCLSMAVSAMAADVPTPEGEGTLRIATSSDVATLNGHNYSMSRDSDAMDWTNIWLYKSMIGEDEKFQWVPELASEYPVCMNEEQTVWQIPLRQGIKWANGDPMNADTVMYSWKMLLDPILVNSRSNYLASNVITIVNATAYASQGASNTVAWEDVGIKKLDDYTVEITTTGPVTQRDIIQQLTFNASTSMVHEATYEKAMNADRTATMYGTSMDTFMAGGAFYVSDWVPGASITFTKNPNYVYADKIWINKIYDRTVSDSSTRLQLFLNGEIDYVELGTTEYEQYEEDPRIIDADATSMRHISVNMGNTENPILQNVNFRKALYWATDRETLADLTAAIPAWYIQPQMVLADTATGKTFREVFEETLPYEKPENNGYNPEKAVEYFEKALEETGVSSVKVTLLYNSENSADKTSSEFLQKSWAEIFGANRFSMEIQGMPNSQMTATKKSWKTNPNSYEMGWTGWSTSKISPWNGYNVWRSTYSGKNEPYMNPELDALWIQANQGVERLEPGFQLAAAYKMEKMMLDDVAIIPVKETPRHFLKSDRVILPTESNCYVVNVGFGWQYSRIVEE